MSKKAGELSFLKVRLEGPILKEIINPEDHSVDDIMKSYFKEILFLAGRYARPTVDYEDLVGEGIMGLLDAIERFDINKANDNPRAFHNLAIVRIKSYMFEFFLANNTQYKIPTYMSRAMNLVEQIRNIVRFEDYNGDTVAAIMRFDCPEFENAIAPARRKKLVGVKERLRNLALNSDKTYEAMVLAVIKVEQDIKSYESEEGAASHTSPEELACGREYMSKLLGNLNPRARDVITLLLEGRTLEEVGKEIDVSRERVRQIRDATIKHLVGTPMYQEAQDD